jgi:hypothetical protein
VQERLVCRCKTGSSGHCISFTLKKKRTKTHYVRVRKGEKQLVATHFGTLDRVILRTCGGWSICGYAHSSYSHIRTHALRLPFCILFPPFILLGGFSLTTSPLLSSATQCIMSCCLLGRKAMTEIKARRATTHSRLILHLAGRSSCSSSKKPNNPVPLSDNRE